MPAAFHQRALVADPVQGAVVGAAERHHEFVADLAAERPRLGEAQVVRVGRLAAADQAGLLGDEPQVLLVAVALGLRQREHALVDAGRRFVNGITRSVGRNGGRWRIRGARLSDSRGRPALRSAVTDDRRRTAVIDSA